MSYEYLNVLSQIVGWTYFFAWSISFYPQAVLNYQRKSVAGFSLEFALLNVSGFFFYAMYSVGGTVYSHLGTGEIEWNDLVFAVHAFFLASIQFTQAFIYDRGEQKTFATWAVVLLIVEWTTFIGCFTLEGLVNVGKFPTGFNTFRVAGYNKALITLLKYMPQVYLNYSRKSTVGWSIHNIMCDFTGGSLSILQQVIDMIYKGHTEGDWSFFGSGGDAFNIVKFMLGVMSVFFDIIFFTQHFILYRHARLSDANINGVDDSLVSKPNRHTLLAEEDDDDYEYASSSKNGKLNYTGNTK